MPALGSSVINKSGKKFAPKAPVRRPAAPPSTQESTRPNVEPFTTSQTPQARIVEQPAKSPSPVPPPSPVTNASVQISQHEATQNGKNVIQERPRDDTTAGQARSPQCGLHKRKLDTNSEEHSEQSLIAVTTKTNLPSTSTTEVSQPLVSTSPFIQVPQTVTTDSNAPLRTEPSRRLSPQPLDSESTQSAQPGATDGNAPATKRRKITLNQPDATLRQRQDPKTQASVPPSSTEGNTNIPARTRASTSKTSALPVKAPNKLSAREKGKQREGAATTEEVADGNSLSTQHTRDGQFSTRVRKPRQAANAKNKQQLQDAATEIVADAVERRSKNKRKARWDRKDRQPTPEEAENETIVPGRTKMADLCKDTRTGKKSDMLIALQERDKDELMKKAQNELQQLVGNEGAVGSAELNEAANPTVVGGTVSGSAEAEVERRQEVARHVAGTYVNELGEIMIDTDSLQVDRHAQAAAEREQGQLEAVEENYLSKPAVNSMTHAKREKPNSWPEELTDEFYRALRMFGTDFDMIGRMLRKTRRAIKLKYTKEERLDPDRIDQTLRGEKIPVDALEFARLAGEELKPKEEHDRMMEEDRKKFEQDAADELRRKEEQDQLRRDQAEQERTAMSDNSSGKENREVGKKKEKRKKGRKSGEKRKVRKKKEKGAEQVAGQVDEQIS
ncbi:MAG: hypothetical protein Q9166_001273 [cf. Caloplaca sp. 2 TL-2023]